MKPLFDFNDDELREMIRKKADVVVYSYNDMQGELDRRSARRVANAQIALIVVGSFIAIAAMVVTAVKP